MTLPKDLFLSGPLSQEDLADNETRQSYLKQVEFAEGGLRHLVDEDETALALPAGTVGLEPHNDNFGLLDYQEDLVSQIVTLCAKNPPNNIGLVALPTGAGKTRTAVSAALKLIESLSTTSILWLAPSRELLEQAVGAFQALWSLAGIRSVGIDLFRCHILKQYPNPARASVYFSTPQMLYQRLTKGKPKLPSWDLVIFDEAHLADAPTFRDALTLARELAGRLSPCFGLSATPGRASEQGTDSLIGLFNRRLLTSKTLGKDAFAALRARGVLANVIFETIPIVVSDQLTHGDATVDIQRFRSTTSLCRSLSKAGRSTIVFSGSVRHAVALSASLKRQGVSAAWVSGAMSVRERDRTLRAFEAGAFSVLVNKTLLATGYDCPAISNVVLTVPIKSAVLFEQMVGRASRGPRVGGNEEATVWYFDDHIKWHGRPSSYQRYALSGWR